MEYMKTYSIDNLTEEQIQLITESLLLSSTSDINANWYKENLEELTKLALQIRKTYPSILLKNVFILKDLPFEDPLTENLLEYFPEIEKEEI